MRDGYPRLNQHVAGVDGGCAMSTRSTSFTRNAVIAVILLALFCLGAGAVVRTVFTSSTPNPDASPDTEATPGQDAGTPQGEAASPDAGSGDDRGSGNGPPAPPGVISVGGPTLEGPIIGSAWGPLSAGEHCSTFFNSLHMPVTITEATVTTSEGPADLQTATCEAETGLPFCEGTSLAPTQSGDRCGLGVRVPDVPGAYAGSLVFRFSTQCTSADLSPCDLMHPRPAPHSPREAVWQQTHPVIACVPPSGMTDCAAVESPATTPDSPESESPEPELSQEETESPEGPGPEVSEPPIPGPPGEPAPRGR